MRDRRSTRLGVLSLLAGLTPCLAFASVISVVPASAQQVSSGTVLGQVLDPSNAAIVGATVKLLNKATSATLSQDTNAEGRFEFSSMSPGMYDVTVVKQGFAQAKISNQEVIVGQQLTLNVSMKVGATTQTVEVTAAVGANLQTMNASVGESVSGPALTLLPNFGLDASSLAVLQPATNPTGETAGANYDQNSFLLNGVNNTNDMDGSMTIYTPSYSTLTGATTSGQVTGQTAPPTGVMPTPTESIEELKVNTNNQSGDFNASAGSQIMMVTKSGTNNFHGTLWEYYEDTTFGGANSWNNNEVGIPNPSSHYNRFGGNIGGPFAPKFWGGKWYFFFEYDGDRFPQVTDDEVAVPSALLRQGVVQINTGCPATPGCPAGAGPTLAVNLSTQTVDGIPPSNFCGAGNNLPCNPAPIGLAVPPGPNGLNSTILGTWSKYEPMPNDPTCGPILGNGCDTFNTQGYRGPISLPQSSNYAVLRLDHDFSSKWHWFALYNYFRFNNTTEDQVDIGGFFSGDTFGSFAALTHHPQIPSMYATGLTTNFSPSLTNNLHVSYLRDFWQWESAGIPPQLSTLGGTLEPGGETPSGVTIPYNVNNQQTRTRFWDGQDKEVRDDVSWLRGNHLFAFGGLYERNYLQHLRNDNGGSIQASPYPVYQLTTPTPSALDLTSATPPFASASGVCPGGGSNCLPIGNDVTDYEEYYAEVLGIITQTQELYTRTGSNLQLQPLGTHAEEQSIVPTYNEYFTDTWHAKPSLTVSYGLGYQIEMPPYEINGRQSTLVDQDDVPITASQYLAETYKDAINGQIYNPILGFTEVGTAAGGEKYPYHAFYKGFSPNGSLAWNPRFGSGIGRSLLGNGKTVMRVGYRRLYGRLNGVDLVLVPLLTPGLLQPVICSGPEGYGPAVGTCGGANAASPATATTAWRIGPTASGFSGLTAPLPAASPTLPQPFFPGVNGEPEAGQSIALDPNFQPNHSDEVDLTFQRELPGHNLIEIGYIFRRLRNEYQPIDLAAVPYMLTLSGQTFAQAWASLFTQVNSGAAITAQPWFENALGGASSAFCKGFASCTAAVAANPTLAPDLSSTSPAVYDFWQALSPNFTFGRSMASSPNCAMTLVQAVNPTTPVSVCQQVDQVNINTSLGYGNYNGAFVSWTSTNWHGLTARSNFTWGRALGTQSTVQATSEFTVPDPWDLNNGYGPQPFDIKFLYNLYMLCQPTWYKSQHGLAGKLLGGWSFSPLFTANSGLPLEVNISEGANADCESFGESSCNNFISADESAVFVSQTAANAAHSASASVYMLAPGSTVGTVSNLNMYANPGAIYADFRAPILGIDTNPGSFALRGMPTWNLDFSLAKALLFSERFDVRLIVEVTNIFNHNQLANPFMDITLPQYWGALTTSVSAPRALQFGARFHF
jgi:Carboxypeptidase regulatory-like domain